jgi:predicted nucleotidyltransferase
VTKTPLEIRQNERDAFLVRAVALLEADSRVVAVWLYGSLGRNEGDEWSDLDMWVVVSDEHIEDIGDHRHEFAARFGHPLLSVDAPQNAPVGGAFLSVVYGGLQAGPQHVDWTWQPQKKALVPHDAKVLFNRDSVPAADAPQPVAQEERLAKVEKQAIYFWMMVPVVAKAIVRRQPWVALSLLTLLMHTLDEVAWLTSKIEVEPKFPTRTSEPPPSQLLAQLAFLREMVAEMKGLSRYLGIGGSAVSEEAIAEAEQFLELIGAQLETA